MKVIVCTGITGSDRSGCLKAVQKFAERNKGKLPIINMWEIVNEISTKPIDESTVLNLSSPTRMQLFGDALREISKRIKRYRENNNDRCIVVATHARFHWKSTYLEAFPYSELQNLGSDMFITIVHNIKDIKANLERDPSHRFVDITPKDIVYWQDHEIMETQRWASSFKRKHYIVARNEPPQTLFNLIYHGELKKIYFSYPMSFVDREQMNEAVKLISTLRDKGYIVFDPGSVDDAKYIDELITTDPHNTEYQTLAKIVDDQTVKQDYSLIDQSDLVIVRYPAATVSYNNHSESMYIPLSAGVICEMVHGFTEGKRVYALWLPEKDPSPFFNYHCQRTPFLSEQELLDYLEKYEAP